MTEQRLSAGLVFCALIPYYGLTILSTSLEGVAMVLLVSIFTGGAAVAGSSGLPAIFSSALNEMGWDLKLPGVVPLLIALFAANLLIRFALLVFDGAISSLLRQRLQETIFERYLTGDWSHMRNFRAGLAVGTNTQEAIIVTKYLTSVVLAAYFTLSALVMTGLALLMSLWISLALAVIALPLAGIMQMTFKVQAKLSRESAALRNEFASDITDRFNGLLQIHVDDNYRFHVQQGIQSQHRLTRIDVLIGACSAIIGSFNLLLPLTALVGFSAWMFFFGQNEFPDLALVASVGIVAMRAATQLNGAVAAIGNLSRLSGSLYPVLEALSIPPVRPRKVIEEPVERVEIDNLCYSYGQSPVIHGVTLSIHKGAPLVLSGRSGRGKTTLANLIAGLYFSREGKVLYIGASGTAFPSTEFRAHVGFVTQDIYLFRGTLRNNLAAGRNCSDSEIWSALEQVDASDFVHAMGGLDTESNEAGRSLSGGQRRRLGIARVILSGKDILIFDEATAGLDEMNKRAVLSVIGKLKERYIIIIISHENLLLPGQTSYVL